MVWGRNLKRREVKKMFDPQAFVGAQDLTAAVGACACGCSCSGGAGGGGGAGSAL